LKKMKKSGILQNELAGVIARLGHTDLLVVADAGLPIPPGVARIDLAVTGGVPGLLQVLRPLLDEIAVEAAVVAEEMRAASPAFHGELISVLGGVPVRAVPHAEFKRMSQQARVVVRTGEFTPYANVMLVAGVAF
jgi:D-ribose pyranase